MQGISAKRVLDVVEHQAAPSVVKLLQELTARTRQQFMENLISASELMMHFHSFKVMVLFVTIGLFGS